MHQKYNHPSPPKSKNAPHNWTMLTYSLKQQYKKTLLNLSQLCNKLAIFYNKKLVPSYYLHAIETSALPTLTELDQF